MLYKVCIMANKITLVKDVFQNESHENVARTTPQLQLVYVTLRPLESIPMETHTSATQMTRVESGKARVTLNDERIVVELNAGEAVWIPSGTKHRITNASDCEKLRLSTVYSPPQH